jgi:hypothetical protein
MVNWQARAIIRALKSTLIMPLVKEAAITLIIPLLNNNGHKKVWLIGSAGLKEGG